MEKISPLKSKKNFPAVSKPKIIFILAILIIIATDVWNSSQDIWDLHSKREKNPFFFVGYIFSGLDDILKDTKYVGYFTDKSMDNSAYAAQFAQAQYTLAPIILDLNNTQHDFILFDCENLTTAQQKIKELQLLPIRRNQFGIILTRRRMPGHSEKIPDNYSNENTDASFRLKDSTR